MKNKIELYNILSDMEKMKDYYEKDVKTLISRLIIIESNLIRLNTLLTTMRKVMIANEAKKK